MIDKSNHKNYLVIDMAEMTRLERTLFRLHANYGVSRNQLAEAFDLTGDRVGVLLERAREKYRATSHWLGIP